MESDERYDFDGPALLVFPAPSGDGVTMTVRQLAVSEAVTMIGSIPRSDVEVLSRGGLFHVGDELDGAAWFDDEDIVLTLRLHADERAAVSTGDQLVADLFSGDSGSASALRNERAWVVVEAVQHLQPPPGMEDAEISAGVRTRWADD